MQEWFGTTTDIITGVITSPEGTPIADAIVEAFSLETQITRRTRTDTRGRYMGTPHEHFVHAAYESNAAMDAYIREVVLGGHRQDPGSNELLSALMTGRD